MKKQETSRPAGAHPAGKPVGLLALIRHGGPLFKDVFTIDPTLVEDAWDTLSIDTSDGVSVGGANVIQPDVAASNGVIHIIDRVILP